MSRRLSVALVLLAALALALAPCKALLHGKAEILGFLRVAAAALAARGLARQAAWGRWLTTLLAVLTLWAAWRSLSLPPELRSLVPDYPLWRAGRVLGALLLVGGAVAAWQARARPARTA